MKVSYIYHSGFLVETQRSCYIFDYYKGELPALDASKPVTVFASHAHGDHYNKEVFDRLRDMGMQRVYAVLAKDISRLSYPKGVEVLRAYANKAYTLPGGETLETLLSTDSGVAFLLTCDEGVIYHAGDLNDWTWEGESDADNRHMRGSYRHEIDKLAGRRIDVAFVPLDPRQEQHYADGMLYFLERAGAERVYPMHYWGEPGTISRFLLEHPEHGGVIQRTEGA